MRRFCIRQHLANQRSYHMKEYHMIKTKTMLFAGLGLVGSLATANVTQAADIVLNGTGSSAGRQYAKNIVPASTTLCDNTAIPTLYQSHENPPNRTEWQCGTAGTKRTCR